MIGTWFRTDFDGPRDVVDLPVEAAAGRDPALCIVDQVMRGTGILGRVTGEFGAVALRLRGTAAPVRVTVELHLDELGTRWWSDRVRPPRTDPERPRLVLVRAQGQIRGAALLARRQGWRAAAGARATVAFDLPAGELDGDGVLVVELAEPPRPSWARTRFSSGSAVGLRIDRITVRPAPAPTAVVPAPSDGASGCDLALLPPGAAGVFRLDVAAVPPAPPVPRSPSNRWTRQMPSRAGFKVLRIARRAALRALALALPVPPPGRPDVFAADLCTGADVGVEVVARRPRGLDLRLTEAAAGPVLLGLTRANRRLSLHVWPAPAPQPDAAAHPDNAQTGAAQTDAAQAGAAQAGAAQTDAAQAGAAQAGAQPAAGNRAR
ncbi:hypothetical protein [Krasilnikovia sp. MM14-A1259]|uniref:hypothetical protein n=1 Tax=Krasilnikovia sp. MM14-A1259 TaxID=3373539 RepID=UPI0037FC485C